MVGGDAFTLLVPREDPVPGARKPTELSKKTGNSSHYSLKTFSFSLCIRSSPHPNDIGRVDGRNKAYQEKPF